MNDNIHKCHRDSDTEAPSGGFTRAAAAVAVVGLVFLGLWTPAASAQTITISGTTTTAPFREFATRELGDPWDMSQRTDLGWFTWGIDSPASGLTSKRIATDARNNTFFSSLVPAGAPDPKFFLLDTWNPGSAKLGRVGVNYPIDTTVYNVLYIKMKFANQVLRSTFNSLGQGLPVFQIFWSRDTIYYDASARPNGGQIRPVTSGNVDIGTYLTPLFAQPRGSVEGGSWVVYRIPLTIADMQTNNPLVDHWQNANGGTSVNWGAAGVTADSLRVDPFNLDIGGLLGEMQIDWARLVSESAVNRTTISWTGGGTYDVVVSPNADCSDFGVIAYSASSGYQFQSQSLSPGSYHVGLRRPFTDAGHTAATGTTLQSCSSSTFTVQEYPSLALTSPDVEGSTDDFATTFLGNAWDFDALTDYDFSRGFTLPDVNFGIVSKAATDPAGTDLGSVRVFRNRSNVGTSQTANLGDPHIYTLWPIPSQVGATAARGLNNHIDASRYRILTAQLGVERTRDVNLGSIARIIWHVAGDQKLDSTYAEIESQDIVLRHLDPATENGGKIVVDTIQADMADRATLPIETDIAQSASGWNNSCTASAVSTCVTGGAAYKAGVDLFRLDFHEFATSTDSEVRRIKLAALERTGSSFPIRWTSTNPNSLTSTVTLIAVPEMNPAANDRRPAYPSCTGASAVTIASGLSLESGLHNWTPTGLTNGTEYYVCAQIFVSGNASPVDEVMSKWPVVIDTTYTGGKPTFQLDKTTLRVAGVHTGLPSPVFSSKTPTETVRIVQSGTGTVNWTLSVVDTNGAAVNWLQVAPPSGTGSGSFTVSLKDDVTLPACTAVDALMANVKLTSSDLENSPQYVQVFGTIYPGATASPGAGCPHTVGVTSPPFGQVDTPVQNAAGVVGAIGVTGWALDDVGVSGVKIYRSCLGFDNPASCQLINGANVVYVGDAAFLAGARPDVELAFSTRPLAYRAGWGYLLLTNMLPDVTNSQAYGGQGTLTLYAFASDADGKTILLGRTQADSTPTNITMANASIAKPFGAIDTPGQGQTVSGVLPNFGWALTPDSNTSAGAGDILIPTNGSTMVVFIDGLSTALVAYNQCRGNVGNPVPGGSYCNDDVANIFGNTTPQASLTTRTANVTKYRNLDAGRAAIGAYDVDTRLLPNGLHTIAWSVTDSAGRNEGIGSRFFIVSNGAADAIAGDRSRRASPSVSALGDAPARSVGRESDLAALPTDAGVVSGRTTFDLRARWQALDPADDGVRRARIPELGRVELSLGAGTDSGYLVANGTLRPLPPGSRLDNGHFTWAPGAGYIGDYRLVFVRDGGQIPVTVTIYPVTAAAGGLHLFIDDPLADATLAGGFRVAGWAADTAAWTGTGVGTVHVWAQRVDGAGAPVFLGPAELGVVRPDVAAAIGAEFGRAGWSLDVPAGGLLAPGVYDITAYVWLERTGRFEDARTVRVTVR